MQMLIKLIPFVLVAAATERCPDTDTPDGPTETETSPGAPVAGPPPPPPPQECTHRYELQGVSEGSEILRDESGTIVTAIDIEAKIAECPVVRVDLTQVEGAELVQPRLNACVTNSDGGGTANVYFDQQVSCGCETSWDWTATAKSPPVKLRVHVRPDTACGT